MRTAAGHHQAPEPPLAEVVEFPSRPPARTAADVTEDEYRASALAYWRNAFAQAGMDVRSPQRPVDVVTLMCREVERLVGGLLLVGETAPEAGIDAHAAQQVTGLLRELAALAERLDTEG